MEVGHEYPRRQFNVAVVVVAVVGVKPRAKMISMQFAPHKSRNVSQGEKPGKEEVLAGKDCRKCRRGCWLQGGGSGSKRLPKRVDR